MAPEINRPNDAWDWRSDVARWAGPRWADSLVSFFELAFDNCRCPQRAWFGVHETTVSLVVGGIFLAAVMRSGEERGFWLLVDQEPPPIAGMQHWPVRATRGSRYPLIWAHSASFSTVADVVANDIIWRSFASASEKILTSRRIAADRDAVQQRRNKRRLSEFWLRHPAALFPDEIEGETVILEGGKRQVTVNAYERDPRARRRCIERYGARCRVCGLSFGAAYGEVAEGFIHVHHRRALSEVGAEYTVDPLEDLVPVCPNCHAVLHLRKPPFTVEELADLVRQRR
ncbi:MAG: HNH endonuclease [Anaerolineae bacterium]|nr:HNH endonuclease [Anaerolineae bacterium]